MQLMLNIAKMRFDSLYLMYKMNDENQLPYRLEPSSLGDKFPS